MTEKPDFGRHYLVDLHGCDPQALRFVASTRTLFLRAAREAKATLVAEAFHQFEPEGVSGVLLIAESHLSLHTWPEASFAAVDIFTCGDEMDAEIAVRVLEDALRPDRTVVRVFTRGRLDEPDAEAVDVG